jgi:hypothetical protein
MMISEKIKSCIKSRTRCLNEIAARTADIVFQIRINGEIKVEYACAGYIEYPFTNRGIVPVRSPLPLPLGRDRCTPRKIKNRQANVQRIGKRGAQ